MQLVDQVRSFLAENTTLFEVFGLIGLGAAGKRLLSNKPITLRLLAGELVVSFVAAAGITAYGSYTSMAHGNIILIGCIVSLIGVDGVLTLIKQRLK